MTGENSKIPQNVDLFSDMIPTTGPRSGGGGGGGGRGVTADVCPDKEVDAMSGQGPQEFLVHSVWELLSDLLMSPIVL